MSMISKKELTEFAKNIWLDGYRGGASVFAKHQYVLSLDESNMIREKFRPLVEAEIAKLKAKPKRELNRSYYSSYITVNMKIGSEDNWSSIFIDSICKSRYVNGRRIVEVMDIEDAMKQPIVSWKDPSSRNNCESYIALKLNDDGTYVRTYFTKIVQPQIEITRKNWARSKCKNDFVKLVNNYVDDATKNGWILTALSDTNSFNITYGRLVFKKTA